MVRHLLLLYARPLHLAVRHARPVMHGLLISKERTYDRDVLHRKAFKVTTVNAGSVSADSCVSLNAVVGTRMTHK